MRRGQFLGLTTDARAGVGGLCAALGCELLLSGGRHDGVINVVRLQAGISALWGLARLSVQCFLRM